MEERVFQAEGSECSKGHGGRKQVERPDAHGVVTMETGWGYASLPP